MNHTAPVASMAISVGDTDAVGISASVRVPSGAMRSNELPAWSVAHTAPSGATATPKGAPRTASSSWRFSVPSFSRVML